MEDTEEAMELHFSARVEGETTLSERELEERIRHLISHIARETGIRLTNIQIVRVGEEETGCVEAEADWMGE